MMADGTDGDSSSGRFLCRYGSIGVGSPHASPTVSVARAHEWLFRVLPQRHRLRVCAPRPSSPESTDKKCFADCGQINGVGSALEAAEMRTWKGKWRVLEVVLLRIQHDGGGAVKDIIHSVV